MAPVPRIRTGTPAGMQGVRPGSPAAIAAGYRPPRRRPNRRRPGGAPFSPSFNPDGTTTLTPPPPPPVPAQTATTTVAFKPDAPWWTQQFGADPRFLQAAPALGQREQQTAASYGYRIERSPKGQPYYTSISTGAGKITQQLTPEGTPVFDDAGRPVYVDESGKAYNVGDLNLSIAPIAQGEVGYLSGALGGAAAGSERRQFEIGDVAAQAGVRRSGMRGQASRSEQDALQGALQNLTGRAAGEFTGIKSEYIDLYNKIYADLVKQAGEQPGTEVTAATPAPTTTTPAVTEVAGGGSVNAAGQFTPPPGALSPQAFDNTLNEVLGPPSQRGPQPMSKRDRIVALRGLLDSRPLTGPQRQRVIRELKKLGFIVK